MDRGYRLAWTAGGLSILVVALLLAGAWPAWGEPAAEAAARGWPQWRGPQRNSISVEKGWTTNWPEGGPKRLWQFTVGAGYSSFAVRDGRLYTMGNAANVDTVWCLDAAKGEVIWKHSYPCPLGEHPGPRATPTLDGKFVYTISREGDLFCLQADSDKVVWSKNVAKEIGAKVPGWGIAGSPLVVDELLIVNVGTAGAALEKASGKLVWQTGAAASGYSSPVLFQMGQRRCVLIFAATGLACVDLKSGERLWFVPWKTEYDVNAADPIVVGERIFISSGYNRGCALLGVKEGKPVILWEDKDMRNHFSTCVLHDGYLYGADDNVGAAVVRCIDFQQGAVKWSSGRLGMASMMMADGKLIVMGDGGRLIVAEATPEAYKPIAQAKVLSGRCWTMPVLAEGRIYCRNNLKGEMVCLDVQGN